MLGKNSGAKGLMCCRMLISRACSTADVFRLPGARLIAGLR